MSKRSAEKDPPERVPLRAAIAALILTIVLITFSIVTFWHAHEQEEALEARFNSFEELVSQAVLVHDAWSSATDDALCSRDETSIRRYRTLTTDTVVVGKRLDLFDDVYPAVRTLGLRQRQLVAIADDLFAVPTRSAANIAQYRRDAKAYRDALSVIDNDDSLRRETLQQHRTTRSRRLIGGLGLAIGALGLTWILVIRAMGRQLRSRREAERLYREASRQNRLILEATADGIVGLDREGMVVFVNPAASRMLAPATAESTSIYADALTVLDNARQSLTPILLSGGAVVGREFDLTRRDGTTFPVEISATPLKDDEGGGIGGVLSIRDITERRELDRMKSEFVATVSHELRTPLTSIRGALGLVAGGYFGQLAEKGQRMLDIALNNTDRLVRLINDILDMERIESGTVPMNYAECNAGELVLAATDSMRPLAEKQRLRLLAAPADVFISADADRIMQVLTNLIGNAIKFSEAGATIDVEVTEKESEALFRIRDHGRGIPADKLDSIFERFQQVDSSDAREKGGTGLGLPICRSIVSRHGGRIWVESSVGEGSTFAFAIPRVPALAAGSGPRATEEVSDVRPRVIVCEDDEQTLEVISAMLDAAGYDAIPARSGEEAIACAGDSVPDAILLDIVLPGMSGWQTLKALQENPDTSQIPIIVLSGLAAPAVPAEGIAAWIEKPAVGRDLYDALDRALVANLEGRQVVIAEDDADLGRVLVTLFERDGVKAALAASGTEAVELIKSTDPDLVVLDLGLPGLDGFEVLDWMRRRTRRATTPIMIYSAQELNADQASRLNQGPTELFVKGKISPGDFERRALRLLTAAVHRKESGKPEENGK